MKPRIAIGWLEFALAVTGGLFGLALLLQAQEFSLSNAIKVAGIPVACAIATGLLFRSSEDRKLPAGFWLAFVFPLAHLALVASVATLAGAHLTGIEQNDEMHPAQLWTSAKVLGAAFMAEALTVAVVIALARKLDKRSPLRADG